MDVVDGELEGVTCALSLDSDGRPGQKTIHGIRYRCKHARFGSICEDQFAGWRWQWQLEVQYVQARKSGLHCHASVERFRR